jgi:hypothetical protein
MKTFHYTARDAGGALKSGDVAAADRAEALGKLKARQLVPVSVTEGARASSVTSRRFDTLQARRAAVAAALAAVAAAVLVGVALLRKGRPAAETAKPAPVAVPARPVAGVAPVQPPAAAPAEEPAPVAAAVKEAPLPPAVPAAPASAPVPAAAPKAEKPILVIDLRPGKTNAPPDGLTSGTERVLNTMFTARLGGPPPPLLYFPPHEATNLVAVLSRDIGVFDDDDEETVARKENLAIVKQKLKEFLGEGGKPEDFMVFYRDILKEAYEERTEMQQAYNALKAAGDETAAAAYFEEANKALLEKGSMPLMAPPRRPRRESAR